MDAPPVGTVVLIPFPFSDPSRSQLRPARVLANSGRGDFILCQITSNPYGDPMAIELSEKVFRTGSLKIVSYARPGKLFTANQSLILRLVGKLQPKVLRRVINAVVAMLTEDNGR